jgi:hypothetical protein
VLGATVQGVRDSSVILRDGLAAPRSPDVAGRRPPYFPGLGVRRKPAQISRR